MSYVKIFASQILADVVRYISFLVLT